MPTNFVDAPHSFPRICSETVSKLSEAEPLLAPLLGSFEEATGWVLQRKLRRGGASTLEIDDLSSRSSGRPVSREASDQLAAAIDSLWAELRVTRQQLGTFRAWQTSQAHLRFPDRESVELAGTLEELLQTGMNRIGATAAGLYLLGESAQQLQLRSFVGEVVRNPFPECRELANSAGDVEAMTGHLIISSDPRELQGWGAPCQANQAGLCLPVASTSNILGTVWFLGGPLLSCSDAEQESLELLASRVAVEIEKDALIREVQQRR